VVAEFMPFGVSARIIEVDISENDMERGEWYYIVTDGSGFTTRRSATYNKSEKTLLHLDEGEVVKVIQRSARSKDGARYLMLDDEMGWAFDRQPGIFNRERLRELQTENGDWIYRAVDPKGVQVFTRPKFLKRQKHLPVDCIKYGEYLDVDRTIQCGSVQFLHLLNRPGWVMNSVEGNHPHLLGPIPMNPDGTIISASYGMTVPLDDPSTVTVTITRPSSQGRGHSQQTCALHRKSAW